MNEQSVKEQYKYVYALIREKRLKEVLEQLESLSFQYPDWGLRTRLDNLKVSYTYMLQYMKQGVADPQRGVLYHQLLREALEITDQARLQALDSVSSHYYHTLRREFRAGSRQLDLKQPLFVLESFGDDLSVSRLLSDEKQQEVFLRHEEALKNLFLMVWTNSLWSSDDQVLANSTLGSDTLRSHDLCLLVSAVTMSLLQCFDSRKFLWLLQAYQHSHSEVSQRSVVGIVFVLYTYRERLSIYPEVSREIGLLKEIVPFSADVARIYKQLIFCQETEKIDRKMREEIIPEVIKNTPNVHNFRFGFDESDEEGDDRNPEWEEQLKRSGLEDKLREMGELQMEGADVYMSTFSSLKGYPFFREIQNWFLPFEENHSAVVNILKETEMKNSFLNIIIHSGFFSNSDKYSLFFTIDQLPASQREVLLSQLTDQQLEEMGDQANAESLKKYADRPETLSNQYLHDFYRFFKLNMRRHEFRDLFREELDLYHVPVLSDLLGNEELLVGIGDFYFKKERWLEALDLYLEVVHLKGYQSVISSDYYQKVGYAYQKLNRYEEAIEAYLRADMIKSDQLWLNRHLANCYRLTHRFDQALNYYRKVEQVLPNNKTVLFNIGSCLVELEQYDLALNMFFKLDFLEESSVKAWRGVAWCSFVLGKHEQALKYYEKIAQHKPTAVDYMNAGHVLWVMGHFEKAIEQYAQSLALCGNKSSFLEMFHKDESYLIRQGVPEDDLPLMMDII